MLSAQTLERHFDQFPPTHHPPSIIIIIAFGRLLSLGLLAITNAEILRLEIIQEDLMFFRSCLAPRHSLPNVAQGYGRGRVAEGDTRFAFAELAVNRGCAACCSTGHSKEHQMKVRLESGPMNLKGFFRATKVP